MIRTHASYLYLPINQPDKLIESARQCLHGVEFDTFVGRGISGAISAPLVARALGKTFLIVRKPGDGTHSGFTCEGELGERWVFIDDLVASGDTRNACKDAVAKLCLWNGSPLSQYVGDFLFYYNGDGPVWNPAG